MRTLNEIERAVSELSPEDLAAFRAWFTEFDRNNHRDSSTKLSEFFRQSPLAEVAVTGELDLSCDRRLSVDR
jgi:hypothetical protein